MDKTIAQLNIAHYRQKLETETDPTTRHTLFRLLAEPCLICGRSPSDSHHLRFTQSRALGSKVSDEFTVPLCRGHHRELHRCGDEAAWWQRAGIDPTVTARKLWLETHPLPAARAETAKGQKTNSTEISRSHGVA